MKTHPEQHDDEVFIGNFDPKNVDSTLIPVLLPTKRLGKIPLKADGTPWHNPDTVPLFVKRFTVEELIANAGDELEKDRWILTLELGRTPLHRPSDMPMVILPKEAILALRSIVCTRNRMGGALYWNVSNDEACQVANHALKLGVAYDEIAEILGQENFMEILTPKCKDYG